MSKIQFFTFLLITLTVSSCESYRILGIFPFYTKSHNIFLTAIAKSLAERNHQVDVITGFQLKNPPNNYNVVVNLSDSIDPITITYEDVKTFNSDGNYAMSIMTELNGKKTCELMGLKEMQKFIKYNLKNPGYYDIVIVEVSLLFKSSFFQNEKAKF